MTGKFVGYGVRGELTTPTSKAVAYLDDELNLTEDIEKAKAFQTKVGAWFAAWGFAFEFTKCEVFVFEVLKPEE